MSVQITILPFAIIPWVALCDCHCAEHGDSATDVPLLGISQHQRGARGSSQVMGGVNTGELGHMGSRALGGVWSGEAPLAGGTSVIVSRREPGHSKGVTGSPGKGVKASKMICQLD